MQTVYIYIDDSGILHKEHEYFIYAGYVFIDLETKETAKREYKALARKIAASLERDDEIKSFGLEVKHKRALYNVMRKHESLSVCVNINNLYDHILDEKKSIHRFKDYALKRVIKGKIQQLIRSEKINPNDDIKICIQIDEQLTASNGYYDLANSVKEELSAGIHNFDYGSFHKPIFNKKVFVDVQFCDSSNNALVQASDILANRHFTSFVKNKTKLRNKPKHYQLHLP